MGCLIFFQMQCKALFMVGILEVCKSREYALFQVSVPLKFTRYCGFSSGGFRSAALSVLTTIWRITAPVTERQEIVNKSL